MLSSTTEAVGVAFDSVDVIYRVSIGFSFFLTTLVFLSLEMANFILLSLYFSYSR